MKTFEHSFIVHHHIDKVWNLYTDIGHLELITPKQMDLKIIYTSNRLITNQQDAVIEGKIGFMKRKWHSKVTFIKKYEYMDEMLKGPFKKWKHIHMFKEMDKTHTEIIDKIEFELPYGILGKLLGGYAYNNLIKVFEYRKIQTINILNNTQN